eukprot:COSAG03_NODE_17303_length_378_cov_428.318996_1_plen_98_part_10
MSTFDAPALKLIVGTDLLPFRPGAPLHYDYTCVPSTSTAVLRTDFHHFITTFTTPAALKASMRPGAGAAQRVGRRPAPGAPGGLASGMSLYWSHTAK